MTGTGCVAIANRIVAARATQRQYLTAVWTPIHTREAEQAVYENESAALLPNFSSEIASSLIPEPSDMVLSAACDELKEFLLTTEEWKCFVENVVIVKCDIGTVTELNGQAIDGIAFPTTSRLSNPRIGSADVVHRRAGDRLDAHIASLPVHLNVGEVHVTSGFDAGVDKLLHVVGPNRFQPRYRDLLQVTYTNIMRAIRRENLQCVALASISTGNLGVRCHEGAQMALGAIKRFLALEKRVGTIGIVCHEQQVFDVFIEEKKRLVDAFNAATPPLAL